MIEHPDESGLRLRFQDFGFSASLTFQACTLLISGMDLLCRLELEKDKSTSIVKLAVCSRKWRYVFGIMCEGLSGWVGG